MDIFQGRYIISSLYAYIITFTYSPGPAFTAADIDRSGFDNRLGAIPYLLPLAARFWAGVAMMPCR